MNWEKCKVWIHAVAAKSLQSCLTLCNPIDGSPPGSSIPGILQARTLEWVAISFSNACMHAKSLQSCPTLYNPMDSSPPASSVHRILQARILEWVAISFSNESIIITRILYTCWLPLRDNWIRVTYFFHTADYSVLLLRGLTCLWFINLKETNFLSEKQWR